MADSYSKAVYGTHRSVIDSPDLGWQFWLQTPGLPGAIVNLDAFFTLIEVSEVVESKVYSVTELLSQILTAPKVVDWARRPNSQMCINSLAGNAPCSRRVIKFAARVIKFAEKHYHQHNLPCASDWFTVHMSDWFTVKLVVTEGIGQMHGKEVCAISSEGEVIFVFSTSGNPSSNSYSVSVTKGIIPLNCLHESGQLSALPIRSRSAQESQDYSDSYNISQDFLLKSGGFIANIKSVFAKPLVSDALKAFRSEVSRQLAPHPAPGS
ncbi:hypothetical protein JCM5296_000041 [Sporobolomyces johnsonii]